MNNELPPVGARVRLTQNVERYPHFIAPAGAVGTVVETGDPNIYAVRLDQPLAGAEDWDNEVHWIGDADPDPTDDLEPITDADFVNHDWIRAAADEELLEIVDGDWSGPAAVVDAAQAELNHRNTVGEAALIARAARLGVDIDVDNCDWWFVARVLDEVEAVPAGRERDAAIAAVNDGASVADRASYQTGVPGFTAAGYAAIREDDETDRAYEIASSDVVLPLTFADAAAIGDALEFLAGVDEGENTDYDNLIRLAALVRTHLWQASRKATGQ